MKKDNIYIRGFIVLMFAMQFVLLASLLITFDKIENLTKELQTYKTEKTLETSLVVESVVEEEPVEVIFEKDEPLPVINDDPQEIIKSYVYEITNIYKNVKPELVMSVIYHESRYTANAKNGDCLGLMQVSKRWHSDRAEKLGVKDFYDPYGNILLGVDYLSELFTQYEDPSLVLMLYNMRHDTAFKLYKEGTISGYAKSVIALANEKSFEGS